MLSCIGVTPLVGDWDGQLARRMNTHRDSVVLRLKGIVLWCCLFALGIPPCISDLVDA
jgi:hypothetical protein